MQGMVLHISFATVQEVQDWTPNQLQDDCEDSWQTSGCDQKFQDEGHTYVDDAHCSFRQSLHVAAGPGARRGGLAESWRRVESREFHEPSSEGVNSSTYPVLEARFSYVLEIGFS